MPQAIATLISEVSKPTPGQVIAKHQAQAPVDVVAIAKDLGINVWSMNSLPESVSGKIFRDPLNGGNSGYSIAVNARDAYVRQRFTVAHEIAHFLLHRTILERHDVIDDAMYRSELSSKEETAANRLAADILMPLPLIHLLISTGIREPEALANKLQVSVQAMKIRLGLPV